MNTLLVGYDLQRPGQLYEPLGAALKAYGAWWHHLDSTWIVQTELSAVQLRNAVTPILDASDKLLVIDITGKSWAGTGFSDRGFAWLRRNV